MSEPVFTVTIPDALIAWGKQPEVEVTFAGSWASKLDTLAKRGSTGHPLTHDETEHMLSLVTALCREAVRAGREDLVRGIDLFLAQWINLHYKLTFEDGRSLEIGRGGRYTWGETRAILQTGAAAEVLPQVERVKNLLAEAFPGARVAEIRDELSDPRPSDTCGSCGQGGMSVMISTEHDTHYCGKCWAMMIGANKFKPTKKATKR